MSVMTVVNGSKGNVSNTLSNGKGSVSLQELIGLGVSADDITERMSSGETMLDIKIETLDINAELELGDKYSYTAQMIEDIPGFDKPGVLAAHLASVRYAAYHAGLKGSLSTSGAVSRVVGTPASGDKTPRISINLAAGDPPKRSEHLEGKDGELAYLMAKIAYLESAAGKGRKLTVAVSEKGAICVYGIGKFPTTLYAGQWETLLNPVVVQAVTDFVASNPAGMARK